MHTEASFEGAEGLSLQGKRKKERKKRKNIKKTKKEGNYE